MKRIVMVGAGPANLFAANHLAGDYKVTILEETGHVGGSGLYSDGKLNFNPLIGGDLTEFMPINEAWGVIEDIRETFKELGVNTEFRGEVGQRQLEREAARSGIRFVRIDQSHIGSDHLPGVMQAMRDRLEGNGVRFNLGVKATSLETSGPRVIGVKVDGRVYPADGVLLAPGRVGSGWLIELMSSLGVGMSYNPIDIGVRVEVQNEVLDEIVNEHGCWDPKFHIYTPSYDDFVRTFCVCPRGFVVKETYEDDLFGVNGYSMRDTSSRNTNFALLARIKLTQPLENTTEYGRGIARLANTLGGRKPILQRLGDLRAHKRSTWDRLNRSYVEPTLREVTPGDISMADSDSTLLYGPEIKFYAMRIKTDKTLGTSVSNLWVGGDGAGVSRGIVGAAASGIIAARGIRAGLG
ncbi:MAG: FAD-dependent oxidoreductase [Candidatus Bathyarchaeota archaeon]|nr:FAD-dependent oxidoreductase [Candidatus Bathyarchaeota archaeon]